MNAVLKNIGGSILRHWLGVLLGIFVARGWMQHDEASSTVALLTNDMAGNLVVSFLFALLPAAWSFLGRQRLRLREKIALCLHKKNATEKDVKRMIAATPLGARMSAIITADPEKITGCVGSAAHKVL
jgi:hypothetical protein